MGARPRRAASLRGELEARRRVGDAVPDEHRNHSNHRNTIEGRSIYVHKDRHQEVWTV